jgi:hypothetical protein
VVEGIAQRDVDKPYAGEGVAQASDGVITRSAGVDGPSHTAGSTAGDGVVTVTMSPSGCLADHTVAPTLAGTGTVPTGTVSIVYPSAGGGTLQAQGVLTTIAGDHNGATGLITVSAGGSATITASLGDDGTATALYATTMTGGDIATVTAIASATVGTDGVTTQYVASSISGACGGAATTTAGGNATVTAVTVIGFVVPLLLRPWDRC